MKTSTPQGIFIVTPSLEGWPTKAKEAPSPHEVRLAPLDTNPVFQSLKVSGTHHVYKHHHNQIHVILIILRYMPGPMPIYVVSM